MNRAVSERPVRQPAFVSVYQTELTAACNNLQAERSELEPLLEPIQQKQVPPQQVSRLIKQVWQRLQMLRQSLADLSTLAGDTPKASHLLEQACNRLQSGENVCLEDGDSMLQQLYKHCLATDSSAELSARTRAMQALIAAIMLDHRRAAEQYAQAASTPGLDVTLQCYYQLQRGQVLQDLGRDFIDTTALEEAIELYQTQLPELAPREQRPDDWATNQHCLGNALAALGQRQRGTRLVESAIAAFENALSVRSRERDPLAWAATQNNLGNALGTLAQRHADTDMLEKSVEAFAAALQVRSREHTPQDWAITESNHATALLVLGQRKKDKTLLKHAADAYKNVLQVQTRERDPMEWAATMNNLGTALRMLGEYRKGPRTLQQSVAAYRSALAERTRERVPQDWAMTQNNLGAALHKLGSREKIVQHLQAAIDAYENALTEWTRQRGALTWAMTRANQASARKALAELSGDAELARRALADFQSVAAVFREASHAQYYELVTEQIALLRDSGQLQGTDQV